jgi:hypothetical protein
MALVQASKEDRIFASADAAVVPSILNSRYLDSDELLLQLKKNPVNPVESLCDSVVRSIGILLSR